ncbi:LysR family transcriptional regulator [Pseudorhodobacter sp. MZDSW-24AT]|uniref:LysR family transcriptional regulator n=1 Tax=Pseudorhodobacter sp. MZDSW-24AT TaxID=2052957 RepID=UPI000C1E965C|nr:LysR family transcriptional regulator [Pseudorhodobacter sp. MZDSW-24AT]PJF09832.1 LysR family transcriptional regulator [Pseudorhodobacter sp. MZDSW-24AT]
MTLPLHHLKMTHLRLLAHLAETRRITAAADLVGVSQPTASRLIVEIEEILGQPVHERSGRGIALTVVGEALARRARRILTELQEATVEVTGLASGAAGHLRIGAVTAPALGLMLPALRTLRLTHPNITADVSVAQSAQLCQELRAGRLDVVLGRPTEPRDRDEFEVLPLDTEPVELLVRQGHPLAGRGDISLADLVRFDWVMPSESSPLGHAVNMAFREHGMPPPRQTLTTGSFLLTLTVVRQTNAIAPLARAVTDVFAGPEGGYVMLEAPLQVDVGEYGLLTRKGQARTPALQRLITQILGQLPLS